MRTKRRGWLCLLPFKQREIDRVERGSLPSLLRGKKNEKTKRHQERLYAFPRSEQLVDNRFFSEALEAIQYD